MTALPVSMVWNLQLVKWNNSVNGVKGKHRGKIELKIKDNKLKTKVKSVFSIVVA